MAVPTSPYSTTAQIASLVMNLVPGVAVPEFTAATLPTVTTVESFQTSRSALLQMSFAAVGYVIPFAVKTGETWPDHQTYFLAILEAMGVAGDIANALKPAPAMAGTKGPASNVYHANWNQWMTMVKESGAGLRAATWTGTRAEKWLTAPRAPMTDYTDGYIDPARFGLLVENLALLEKQFEQIANMHLDWDYIYSLR